MEIAFSDWIFVCNFGACKPEKGTFSCEYVVDRNAANSTIQKRQTFNRFIALCLRKISPTKIAMSNLVELQAAKNETSSSCSTSSVLTNDNVSDSNE